MNLESTFKTAGIAFIAWWIICAIAGLGLTGLIIYILYRIAVLLS
jgi:hypothetical protein